MSVVSAIDIVLANDCKIASGIYDTLHAKAKGTVNDKLNRRLYKEFKRIEQAQPPRLFVFIVSPYLDGKHCRSIRRFQRKLDNLDTQLPDWAFLVICVNEQALSEGNKLLRTLRDKRKSAAIVGNVCYPQQLHEVLSSITSYLAQQANANNSNSTGNTNDNSNDSTNVNTKVNVNGNEIDCEYDLHVAYGTQTGNALQICTEMISQALAKNEQYRINGPIALNEINLNLNPNPNANHNVLTLIIVVSTTGDGEVPQNADLFYRKLKMKCLCADNQHKLYAHVKYAILGLGDSNYSQFNAAAKNIDKCLSHLGAHKFYHTGYADDGIGLEDVVEPWLAGILHDLQRDEEQQEEPLSLPLQPTKTKSKQYTLHQLQEVESSINFSTGFRVLQCANSETTASSSRYDLFSSLRVQASSKSYKAYDANNPFLIELIAANYETAFEREQYCDTIVIRVTFRLPHGYSYEIGDVLCIHPPNPEWMVHALLARLRLNGDDVIRVSAINEISSTNPLPHIPFKKEITIYDIFRFCIDIRSIPKSKLFLKILATFCKDDADKIMLLNLSLTDMNKMHCKFATLLHLLESCTSCYPSLQCLLHFLPELKVRKYSICCSPNYKPDEIDICVRVLKHDISVADHYLDGFCSCFLYSLCCHQSGVLSATATSTTVQVLRYEYGFRHTATRTQIAAFLKLSPHFKPPLNPLSSLILVGPGTGVAVFRAFLQHRQQQTHTICDGPWRGIDMQFTDDDEEGDADEAVHHANNTKCVLLFGCRHPEKDYLFKQDWQRFREEGVLTDLLVAFSRYHENKVYVQHLLKEQSRFVSNLILNENAYIFVCGDAAKMAKDVQDTFIEIIALHSKMSILESSKYVENMKLCNRYAIDIWTGNTFI